MAEVLHQAGAMAAAHLFRNILGAMSRPGRRVALAHVPAGEDSLLPASLAVITTLCDYQTPVFLGPALASAGALRRIRFDTGAPVAEQPEDAAFALVQASEVGALLGQFAFGSHEYPDRSTTLLVQLPDEGHGSTVEFSGPGVGAPVAVSLAGLGADFWAARAQINLGYPLGLDFIFVQEDGILACPRSTSVRLMEAR
ncbi:MAG: phosphonate C-P lyase system protein PhnH [Alphaproteobacteria bacterium]|nr:phosphonate C-P lyase system protein PhnH [Alphaproteobacteria bacterium]